MKALFVSVLAAPAMLFFATSAYAQTAATSSMAPPPSPICPDNKCDVEFKGTVPEGCTCSMEKNGLLGAVKNLSTGFVDVLDSAATGGSAASIYARCNSGKAMANVAITSAVVTGPGPYADTYKINATAATVGGPAVAVGNPSTVAINAKLTGLTTAGNYLIKLTTTVSP
jgi:hypothetical protein